MSDPFLELKLEKRIPWEKNDESNHIDGLLDLINVVGLQGKVVVEIGPSVGVSTETFLQFKPDKLYTIDRWAGPHFVNWEEAERGCRERLRSYPACKIIKGKGIAEHLRFPVESLDFVYLNVRRDSKLVHEGIVNWYPKIKKQGFIGGHGYGDQSVRNVVDLRFSEVQAFRDGSWLARKKLFCGATHGNVVMVGTNDMKEFFEENEDYYLEKYSRGIFIEANPASYERLRVNLDICNKFHSTNYKGINSLITNEEKKIYDFYLRGAGDRRDQASSIYPHTEAFDASFPALNIKEKISLPSRRLINVLRGEHWEGIEFDMVLDVEGAEIEVLESCGKLLDNVQLIKTEVSTTELNKGGALVPELDKFLQCKGFSAQGIFGRYMEDSFWEKLPKQRSDIFYGRR